MLTRARQVKSTKVIKFIDWFLSVAHYYIFERVDMVPLNPSALLRHCGHQTQAGLSLHSGDSISDCDCFGAHVFGLHLSVRLLLQFCCRGGLSNPVTQGKLSPKLCLDHHNFLFPRQSVSGCRDALPEHSAKTHCPALHQTHHILLTTSSPAPGQCLPLVPPWHPPPALTPSALRQLHLCLGAASAFSKASRHHPAFLHASNPPSHQTQRKSTAVRDCSPATALACNALLSYHSFLQLFFTYFCSPIVLSRKLSGGREHCFVPQLHSTGLVGMWLRFLSLTLI